MPSASTAINTAISIGDPAGIGPELALRILQNPPPAFRPILIGSAHLLKRVSQATGIPIHSPILTWQAYLAAPPSQGAIIDFPIAALESLQPGQPSALSGHAAYHWLTTAIDAVIAGHFNSLVTCPLSKEALHLGGHHYNGHTEILVERTQTSCHAMMLTSPEVTTTLVTSHIPLASVPTHITTQRILEVTRLTAAILPKLYPERPEKNAIAVLGLNPHAGENGIFGNEESRIIQPAINQLRTEGHPIIGPLPPDTAFIPALRSKIAAHIAMYHDQGLIPLKTLSFDEGVNITLGLPIVRTSPDHGTAYDIAWQARASDTSLRAACLVAQRLTDTCAHQPL